MNKKIIVSILCIALCGCSSSSSTSASTPASTAAPTASVPVTLTTGNYMDYIDKSQTVSLIEDWNHTYRVMAHAMGGIDNHDYTNSLDAFVQNYNEGTKLFEIDLERTEEGDIVLTHTWKDFRAMLEGYDGVENWSAFTNDEFKSAKIYGSYTTLSFADLLNIMEDLPDFYVIIDSKTFDTELTADMYNQAVAQIKEKDPELLKRFVPQAYNPDVYEVVSGYGFDKIIYTLYSIYDTGDPQKIYEFIKDNNIPVVVMHMDNDWAEKVITDIYSYAKSQNYENNFSIYIHTVNDPVQAVDVVNEYHFFGIYSDFISESEFDKLLS